MTLTTAESGVIIQQVVEDATNYVACCRCDDCACETRLRHYDQYHVMNAGRNNTNTDKLCELSEHEG